MSFETAFQVKIILCVFWIKWNLSWIFYVHMLTFLDKNEEDFIWDPSVVTLFKLISPTYMLNWNWFTPHKLCISYELEISLPIVWTGFTKNGVFDLLEVKFIFDKQFFQTNTSKQSLFVKDTVYSTAWNSTKLRTPCLLLQVDLKCTMFNYVLSEQNIFYVWNILIGCSKEQLYRFRIKWVHH